MLRKAQGKSAVSLTYQLIKLAWDHAQCEPQALDPITLEKIKAQAKVAQALMIAVLNSAAAKKQKVRDQEVDVVVEQLQAQFETPISFDLSLKRQGLSKQQLQQAIYQDLLCEKTIAAQSQDYRAATEQEALDYYQQNKAKFMQAERRKVSHILITINDQYPENKRGAVILKLTELRTKLLNKLDKFAALALSHSECPTALNAGLIGTVTRGQLYPELDKTLFLMQAESMSGIVESEIGLHLLLCHEIFPAHQQLQKEALPLIREQLNAHRRKKCERKWLSSL